LSLAPPKRQSFLIFNQWVLHLSCTFPLMRLWSVVLSSPKFLRTTSGLCDLVRGRFFFPPFLQLSRICPFSCNMEKRLLFHPLPGKDSVRQSFLSPVFLSPHLFRGVPSTKRVLFSLAWRRGAAQWCFSAVFCRVEGFRSLLNSSGGFVRAHNWLTVIGTGHAAPCLSPRPPTFVTRGAFVSSRAPFISLSHLPLRLSGLPPSAL